ncbi:MAG: heparinase II/III family protein [Verrucomicrobiota bacterium]
MKLPESALNNLGIILACLAAWLNTPIQAATLTWTGAATMIWNSTDSNWGGPLWNNSTPDSAVFGMTGAGQVNLATPITANTITFNTAGYTITNITLTLGGTAPAITNNAAATIASVIAGSAGLTKEGIAELTLTASNTFTGNVILGDTGGGINAGSIIITSGGALGTGSKTVYIRNGSTSLELDGSSGHISLASGIGFLTSGTAINNLAGTNTISGTIQMNTGAGNTTVISGAGALTLAGGITSGSSSRTLVLSGNSTGNNTVSGVIANGSQPNSVNKIGLGTWQLAATNTYSGTTVVNAGELVAATGGSCSNSAVTVSASAGNNAILSIATTSLAKQWTCSSLTVSNAGNGSALDFNFGSLIPSQAVAPLNVLGAATFVTVPVVTVTTGTNYGPVGAQFPLMTWGSVSGAVPTNVTLNTLNSSTGHLVVSNSTLYLVIDNYTPTLSDSQLFSALNLNYPGLQTVAAFVASNDFANARTALASYLRTRTNIFWSFDWHHPTNAVSYDQAGANAVTNGTFAYDNFSTNFPGGNIDWSFEPSPTSQWPSLINRMDFWANLGATYWATGDEGYARAWVKQFRSWVAQEPVPGTEDFNILDAWATIDAGARMSSGWPDAFFYFVLSPSVSDDNLITFMKSCVDHGRYLTNSAAYDSQVANNNIYAWEMGGLYTVGAVFPELNEAAGWRAFAAGEMFQVETNQFYPDGAQIELSPRYHIGTMNSVMNIYDVAVLNHLTNELAPGFLAKMEKPFEFLLGNIAPSGFLPPFNDCGADNDNAIGWLTNGYSYFPKRPDFLWLSGAGAPPAQVSWFFPYAGYAAMRSSWDPTANYLCFQGGPSGASSHRHADSLNVVIWSHGREILFDSGGGSYQSTIWRSWGTSSYSHNCITVDGLDQKWWNSGTNVANWWGANNPDFVTPVPQNLRWESDVYHDFAAQIYNRGFGGNYNNRLAAQTRRVLFVKPDIYVVADTLVPMNGMTHTYQARWQLRTTNCNYSPATKVMTTTDASQPNLVVIPCLASGLTVMSISGQTSYAGSGTTNLSEMLGWDQPDLSLNDITPATTVLHTLSGLNTQQFLTVFLPLQIGATNPVLSVSNLAPSTAQITLNDARRLIIYADPNPTNGLKFTEIMPDNSTNRNVVAGYSPPVITGLTNLAALPSAVLGPLPFTVTDNSPISNVVVTVHSLNQSVVADTNLTLSGTGTNRTLTLALTPNQLGVATIVVTAVDPGGSTMSGSFDLTVPPGTNTPPTASAGTPSSARNVILNFDLCSVASDAETTQSNLLFTVANATNGTVSLLADGHTARFAPANNFTGVGRFTYTVTDLGEDARELFHYAFDPQNSYLSTGNVFDFSGNNRPGNIVTVGNGSALWTNDTPSLTGRFDAQSIRLTENGDANAAEVQRIINAIDLNLNSQTWTFACWLKRATSTNDDFIFHLGSGNGYGSDEELQLWCPANQNKVGLYHWNGTVTDFGFYSSSVVTTGQWHHVAVTYTASTNSSGNVALYLDGSLAGSASNIPFDFDQTYPVCIGGHPQSWSAASRWFNGNLDDAVMFKVALSAGEIAQLATNSVVRFGGVKATNSVTVLVGATVPQISSTGMTNGQLQFSVSGTPGFKYSVQASTNLATWDNLVSTNPPTLPFVWKDGQATNFNRRFYRVLLGP